MNLSLGAVLAAQCHPKFDDACDAPVWPPSSTNLDHDSDIVRRGAFSKSLDSGTPIPLIWMQNADDPRCYVGDVIEGAETAEGLAIKGRFDLDTEFGKSAYRNTKGRRVSV